MTSEISPTLIVEILATAASLIYLVFLIKEKTICWPFSIAGSLLSIYLFVDAKLYSEAALYGFYAIMGCWGWIQWHKRIAANSNPVIQWSINFHRWALLLGSIVALCLGYGIQSYSDAERPLIDAFTTVFSVLATYMEINKVLEGWIYWMALNVVSVWLYHDRALDIYAVLIGCYSLLSIWGFISWRRTYRLQRTAEV